MHCEVDGTSTERRTNAPSTLLDAGAIVSERYAIDEVIGRGGFGVVYGARHVRTNHSIAIKMLQVESGSNLQELKQRFIQEAESTAKLSHPNTVRVFDFGETDEGELFIAMERLVGETLQECTARLGLSGQLMPLVQVVEVGIAVLRSLSEAHAHGLIHRDLKPANIFLHEVAGGESIVKVLDFGIVKSVEVEITQVGQAMGTPTHMSPEQAMGKKIDSRSDLYSLACVLFECICGQLPFNADNPLAMVMQHLTEPVPSIAQRSPRPVPEALRQVVERALAKNPDDRWADAAEFRVALQGLLHSLPTEDELGAAMPAPRAQPPGNNWTEGDRTLPAVGSVGLEQSMAGASTQPRARDDGAAAAEPTTLFVDVDSADVESREVQPIDSPSEQDLLIIGSEVIRSDDGLEDPVDSAEVADFRRELLRSPLLPDFGSPQLAGTRPPKHAPRFEGLAPQVAGSHFGVEDFARGLDQLTRKLREKNEQQTHGDRVRASAMWIAGDGGQVLFGDGSGAVRMASVGQITESPVNVTQVAACVEVGFHDGLVSALVPFEPARQIISAGLDGSVRFWQPETNEEVSRLDFDAHPTSLALSNDAQVLLIGFDDGSAALVNCDSKAVIRTLRGHKEAITAVAMAGSRRELVTAGEQGFLRAWDPVGGGARLSARGHEGAIAAVAMSRCGSMVVSAGWDGTLRVWAPRRGVTKHVIEAHSDIVAGVAIHLQAGLLASVGDDAMAKIWSLASGHCVAERQLPVAGKTLRFSDDGRCVYIGCWDGTVSRLSAVGPLGG